MIAGGPRGWWQWEQGEGHEDPGRCELTEWRKMVGRGLKG